MKKRFSSKEIHENLHSLGVKRGDTLLIKVDAFSVGLIADNPRDGLLNSLIDYLGPDGTVVTPAFTKSYFLPFLNKEKKVFSITGTPNTGSFAKAMLKNANHKRSLHPTNSFIAIGKHAEKILIEHDHNSHSYHPLNIMMDLSSKALIIGCLDSSPGHLTAHLAQYDLNQSTKNIFKGLIGANFYKDNRLITFRRKDIGGHAHGASKFYKYYEENKAIMYGYIGNARTGISFMKDAYIIEKNLFANDPRFILCDDPLCFSCRFTWRYNMSSMPGYLIRKAFYMIKNHFANKK